MNESTLNLECPIFQDGGNKSQLLKGYLVECFELARYIFLEEASHAGWLDLSMQFPTDQGIIVLIYCRPNLA